jgi:hypothetical protein
MGIYRFDGEAISYMYEKQWTETPNGGAFGIRSIAEDKHGLFWICNANYKYRILPDQAPDEDLVPVRYERQVGSVQNERKDQYYLSIISDDDKNLWMITYDNGVWKYDGNEFIHYPVKAGNVEVRLLSIYKDNRGLIWLGSQDSGVFRFNGTNFEEFEW